MIGDQPLDPVHGNPIIGGTVYLATADDDGSMASFIHSNFKGFGSGIVVAGTGISLQNRGLSFKLDPGHVQVISSMLDDHLNPQAALEVDEGANRRGRAPLPRPSGPGTRPPGSPHHQASGSREFS